MTDLTTNGELKPNDKIVIQDQSSRRMRTVLPDAIVNYIAAQLDPERIPLQIIESDDSDRSFDLSTLKKMPRYVLAQQSSGTLTIDHSNVGQISTGNHLIVLMQAFGDCRIGFGGNFRLEYGAPFELFKNQFLSIRFISLNNVWIQEGEISLV